MHLNNYLLIGINNYDIGFQIDSCASVNVIFKHGFNKLKNMDLKTSDTKIFACGSKTLVSIKGCFYSNIIFHDRIDSAKFYFIGSKNKQENTLGVYSATNLAILKILNSITNEKDINSNNARETTVSGILNKYESIFHVIWKMKDVKVKLAIDESVTPVAQKHCCVPVHLCDKIVMN